MDHFRKQGEQFLQTGLPINVFFAMHRLICTPVAWKLLAPPRKWVIVVHRGDEFPPPEQAEAAASSRETASRTTNVMGIACPGCSDRSVFNQIWNWCASGLWIDWPLML